MTAGVGDWARFRDAFAGVVDQRFYPIEWLDDQVRSGNFVLLTQGESAILISVRTYPSGLRELHGECAVGKREVITDALIPIAIKFGQEIGCAFASISSRPGWDRVMRSKGWTVHQTTIRKAL